MSGTDYTQTPNLQLFKPNYNADVGQWGAHLNANADTLDHVIGAGSAATPSSTLPLMDGTAATGTLTSYARGDHVHPTNTATAPLASPAFTGTPTAPTATAGTNTTQLATTQFVTGAITASTTGVASWNTRTGAVTLTLADLTGIGGAPLASPAFTGTPTAPTAGVGTNNTQVATTAFVLANTTAAGVSSFNNRSGAVTLAIGDVTGVGGAPLASPNFTGIPIAPTAAPGTNTQQLATCAFVAASPLPNGVTNGSNAAAGQIGEVVSNSGSVTLPASGAIESVATLSLGPGDWNISGNVQFAGTPSNPTATIASISLSAGALASPQSGNGTTTYIQVGAGSTLVWAGTCLSVATYRLNINTTTSVYLLAAGLWSGGASATAGGTIWARRAR